MKGISLVVVASTAVLTQSATAQALTSPWAGDSIEAQPVDSILMFARDSFAYDTVEWHGDQEYLVFEEFGRLVVGPRVKVEPVIGDTLNGGHVDAVTLQDGYIVARIESDRRVDELGIAAGTTYVYLDLEGQCPRPFGVAYACPEDSTRYRYRAFGFAESLGEYAYSCEVELLPHVQAAWATAHWSYVPAAQRSLSSSTVAMHYQSVDGCKGLMRCSLIRWRRSGG